MMGIQLPGNEFQDMSGALPIAAVEQLIDPVYLDDCFIETNNISDFDANKGTHKLHGLNEMTINNMNVDFAHQLQPENRNEEEQFMKDVPGEEELYNMLRLPHSEELVSLTQPSFDHETLESESLFTQLIDNSTNNNNNSTCKSSNIIATSEDSNNSSSYIAISPGSPLPTERDCIATSELHNYKYMDDKFNFMQDDETSYRIEFSPEPSNESSPLSCCDSINDDDSIDIEQILKQLINPSQQQQQKPNLKRSIDHLACTQMKVADAKKSRLHIPINRVVIDDNVLATKVPDTPEVCDMVANWFTDDINISLDSYGSSPSYSGTVFEPIVEPLMLLEPKFENPPSIASSYIGEENIYATPSPSDGSTCTHYSTNPNSPAVSVCGNGSARKPRGRPPKQHSDQPDPAVLSRLPESERKRLEDRCKNNEASRQSRQKNKEKQKSLQAEEEHLQRKNEDLNNKLKSLNKIHNKIKEALRRDLKRS